ncbi:MAG: tripartite tricarboxylate transporter TctB family protein, partial [Actinomycetota bacterium]|nr:tripartite tricarboxylate transporter TctB family protein [Actinomycetota bacterium]
SPAAPASEDGAAGPRHAPLLAGLVMVAAGVVLLLQIPKIPGEGLEVNGPRFLPLVVLVIWTALSIGYLGQQVLALVRRRPGLPTERFERMPAAAVMVALLVGYGLAMTPVGYLISTTVFFVATAFVLGSRHLARDTVVAVVLTVGVYFAFTQALGVRLPPGVLPL